MFRHKITGFLKCITLKQLAAAVNRAPKDHKAMPRSSDLVYGTFCEQYTTIISSLDVYTCMNVFAPDECSLPLSTSSEKNIKVSLLVVLAKSFYFYEVKNTRELTFIQQQIDGK